MSSTADESAPSVPGSRPGVLRRFFSGLWRWTKRVAIVLAAVLLIGRATLGLWLPKVANAALKPMGLHVSWTDLDLSLLGLSLDLVGVRVVPLPEEGAAAANEPKALETYLATARPLARIDDLGLDADVSALLTGDLRVHRVEVGGVEAWIDRSAEGTWSFERHLPAPAESADAADGESESDSEGETGDEGDSPAEDPDSAAQPKPLDFTIPVEIATVDLHGVRLHLDDQAATPALVTTLDLSAQVRDVGHDDRPIEVRITGAAEGVLDALLVEASATLGVATVVVDLDAQITGVGLQSLRPYLVAAGIEPSASKLNARTSARIDLAPLQPEGTAAAGDDGDSDVVDLCGTIELSELALDADGEIAAELKPTKIQVSRARAATFLIESVACEGVVAQATKLPDGTLRVAGLDLVGAPPRPSEDEVENADEDDASTAGGPAPVLRIDSVTLDGVALTFRDESFEDPLTLRAAVKAGIESIVLDPAQPGAPLSLSLTASLEDAGTLDVSGSVVPTGERIAADVDLKGSQLTLAAIQPYLESAGIRPTLQQGALAADVHFSMVPGAEATGSDLDEATATPTILEASLTGVRFTDGDTVHAALETVRLAELRLEPDGRTILERLSIEGGSVPFTLFPGGAFQAAGLETLGLDPAVDVTGRVLGV
ncbi:MAG: DUF748 domain-containing protein, partial [Planctomycetota bacterium]